METLPVRVPELLAQIRLAIDLWKDCKCDPWCNSQTSACETPAFRRCDCGSADSNSAKRIMRRYLENLR